jgi:predicted nucleic acid-binding protein
MPSRVLCIDASALADLLLDRPRAPAVAQVLAGADVVVAPDLVNAEVLEVIRRLCRIGEITDDHAARAVAGLEDAPLQRIPTTGMLDEVWSLRHNVAPDDACYVVAARALAAPLLTADLRLARAPDLGVPIITV